MVLPFAGRRGIRRDDVVGQVGLRLGRELETVGPSPETVCGGPPQVFMPPKNPSSRCQCRSPWTFMPGLTPCSRSLTSAGRSGTKLAGVSNVILA